MQPVSQQRSSWFGHLPRAHCRSVVWWGESAFYPISWTENKYRFLAHCPSALCRASWSRPIYSTATTEPTKSAFRTPLTTWRWRTSWLLSPICSLVSFGLWKGSWNGKKNPLEWCCFWNQPSDKGDSSRSATGFKRNLVQDADRFQSFCNKIFAGWDFCITNENAAKLKRSSVLYELRVNHRCPSNSCWSQHNEKMIYFNVVADVLHVWYVNYWFMLSQAVLLICPANIEIQCWHTSF